MCEILAIDKTLIRDFEPELKAQSNKNGEIQFPTTNKISTISIKGQENDDLCL